MKMKIITILAFVAAVVLNGCANILPLPSATPAQTTFFEGEYRGAISPGSWGNYMEVKLQQPKEGTEHGWLVHGTGRSYIKDKPVEQPNYKIEFMLDGHVTPDDLQKAELYLYKYELYFDTSKQQFYKKGTINPPYSVEATSDLKKIHLIIKDSSGNIQVDAELPLRDKTLIGGA
jgi:hypothetical protein